MDDSGKTEIDAGGEEARSNRQADDIPGRSKIIFGGSPW